MSDYTRHRFRKNVPGPFYTTGDCLACDAPEYEAPDLLAPLTYNNSDTYFVRQPSTPDEVERACRALESCCVAALRYGGSDPNIIRRLGNDPEYCDRLLAGGPIPRPKWIPKPWTPGAAEEPKQPAVTVFYPQTDWHDGFPLVEETRTDGWCYAAITEFNEPECHPNGCESGEGYVTAPDGSRTRLVWSTGTFAAKWTRPLGSESSGVYEVAFPKPVKNLHDLVECFRSVVPQLQFIHTNRQNS